MDKEAIGVACSLGSDPSEGHVQLIFQDIRPASDQSNDACLWKAVSFYTSMTIDAKRFSSGELTKDEFEQIGFAVVLRIIAGIEVAAKYPR